MVTYRIDINYDSKNINNNNDKDGDDDDSAK